MSVYRYVNNTDTDVTGGSHVVKAYDFLQLTFRSTGLEPYVNNPLDLYKDWVEQNNYAEKIVDSAGNQSVVGTLITLTGVPGIGNPISVVLPYGDGYTGIQFYRNGVAISGATTSPYIQVAEDVPAAGDNISITAVLSGVTKKSTSWVSQGPELIITVPGTPVPPVLTALAGAVSVAWSAPTNGGTTILQTQYTALDGSVTDLVSNPQVIPATNGVITSGKIRARNAIGWGQYSLQSSAVTPMLDPNKLTQLVRIVESGDISSGYVYTGVGTAGFGNSSGQSVLAGHFASGIDGSVTLKVLSTPVTSGAEIGLGVSRLPAPASYSSLLVTVVNHPNGYQTFLGSTGQSNTGYVGAINDLIRMTRTGSTLIVAVSKNNGTSWTTVSTQTVPIESLYIHVLTAFTGKVGNISSTGLVVDSTLPFTPENYAITMDGNSLVYGTGASDRLTKSITAQLATLAPFNNQFAITNIGVAGQTIANMRARADYPNNSYNDGKNNILLIWEGTNSICNTPGMTGLEAATEMAAYIADRRAVRPRWKIILITTLPRFSVSVGTIVDRNAELLSYNDYIKANYLAMGADAVVDVRSNGKFVYTAGSTTANGTMAPFMSDSIHLNDSGYLEVANLIAPVVTQLIS